MTTIKEVREAMDRAGRLITARVADDGLPPFRAVPFAGDCGLDLSISEATTLRMGQTANIPCGVAVALPAGTFGLITARSSTWIKYGLLVVQGIIDEGWRGELRTLVYKPYAFHHEPEMSETTHLAKGTRIAQLIVLPNLLARLEIEEVASYKDLPPSERGTSGFGSSG